MRQYRARRGHWVALGLGASLLVALPTSPAAAADPTSCPFVSGPGVDVSTWTGAGASDRWGDANNWSPVGVPNDNTDGSGDPETHDTYVCISPAARSTVVVSGDDGNFVDHYVVQAFYLGASAAIDIRRGASLTAENASVESYASPSSSIGVTSGTLGGTGTIRSRGTVSVAATDLGGASLSSTAPGATVPTTAGLLVIDAGGELQFPNLGVNVQRRYRIELRGTGRSVVSGTGAVGANYGTRFEIGPAAELVLAGPGGYYQGSTDGFSTLSELVNRGRLVKTGGGTSVIDADYTEVGDGEMTVESGTVAFPDGTTFAAQVQPGQRMSTEQCAPTSGFRACAVETDPNADPQSISLRMPAQGDVDGAEVTVLERQPSTPCAMAAPSAGSVVFDGDAHAEDLTADPNNPAVVRIRIDARCGSSAQLFTVLRDDQPLPSCLGTGSPPAGTATCLDLRGLAESSSSDGANVYVVARTTQTSRWRVRKEARDLYTPTVVPRGNASGKLKRGKITVTLGEMFAEQCTVHTGGTLRITNPKVDKKLAIRDIAHSAAPNAPVSMQLKPKRNHAKFLTKQAKSGKAKLRYHCDDFSGNATLTRTVTIRLK